MALLTARFRRSWFYVLTRSRSCSAVFLLAAILAPGAAGIAGAAATPDVQSILTRYLQAVKGAADRERSTHAQGTISAFGLQGTFEQWTARPSCSPVRRE